MKKLIDEELDRQLLSALSTPPREGLTMDFSAKLHRNLKHQLQRANRLRFYIVWGIIFLLVMALLLLSLQLIDRAYHTQVTQTITEHKWIFITCFPVIFLIQYLDHISIKHHQLKKYNDPKDSL